MFFCPKCKIPLKKSSNPFGIFWYCPTCSGRAVSLQVLRKVIPQNIINKLWQRAKSGEYKSYRQCPICEKDLPEVPVINDDNSIRLDVCTKCCFVWFDGKEYESLPKREIPKTEEKEKLPLEAGKALTLLKIENMKKSERLSKGIYKDSPPGYLHQKILGYLGFPIENNSYTLKHAPIITWLIGFLMVAFTLIFIRDPDSSIKDLGLIPNKYTRFFGFTFITSFFLHAGFAHLFGNLYFLLVFGKNVEDVLDKKKYILMIITAALAGDLMYIIFTQDKSIPSVGASAGISGILTYYCLRFPDASLSVFYFIYIKWGWLRVNVKVFMLFWIVLQVLIAIHETSGTTDVSGLAHLGGAGIGFLFWAAEVVTLSKSTETHAEEFQFVQNNDK